VIRVAAVTPLHELSATGQSTARNLHGFTIVKGDVPGQDAGEFSASLARHKRYCLLALGQSEKTVQDRCYAMVRLDRWLRRERRVEALAAGEDDLLEWAMSLPWKASSRATEICRIKAFYQWRVARDGATSDPSRTIPIPEHQPYKPHPIEDDVLVRAFQLARTLPDWRIGVALLLAAFGGLRIGEIARLRRENFRRLRDGQVVIDVVGKGRGGGKQRDVQISAAVFNLLVESGLPGRGPVMPRVGDRPGPLTPVAASHLLNKFLHRDVGTHYTFHSLRHWFGPATSDLTRDIRLVQELMGHASSSTTAGYVKIVEARSSEAADALDARLPDLGLAPVHDLAERRRRRRQGGGSGHGGDTRRADRPIPSVADPFPKANRDLDAVSCHQLPSHGHHDRIR
jgi:integrase